MKMRNHTILLLGAAAAATFVASPVTAQRRGPMRPASDGPPIEMGGPALFNAIRDDLNGFTTEYDLSDNQRSRLEAAVNEFSSTHQESMDRMAVLRDSVGALRPLRGQREEVRTIMREYGDLMRELQPAFRDFQDNLGDVLTWNQGREVMARYGPSARGRVAMNRRQRPGRAGLNRGGARPMRGPWAGFRGRD